MKRIVCIGDSNTYGYDPRSFFGGRYPKNVRWTGLLCAAGYDVSNFGENGMCVPRAELAGNLLAAVSKEQPDIITVMLGSNDILNGQSASSTAQRMDAFLDALGSAVTDARIVLISPPAMKIGEWVSDPDMIKERTRLAQEYRSLSARRNIAYADSAAWDTEVGYDGVHLTENGHRAFARGIRSVLENI